ncbi:hypothetical protein B296_00034856 [Ensete ventricosum]|uniref:Uncharacterized protein n=1 Tax=Ensete ventricosum TaxID=4639 RepID=A0A427A460_ENSVE|nr:hypothetical protein B296_00034856 [Ensete ventricosum]
MKKMISILYKHSSLLSSMVMTPTTNPSLTCNGLPSSFYETAESDFCGQRSTYRRCFFRRYKAAASFGALHALHGMFVVSIAYRNAVAAAVVAPIRSVVRPKMTLPIFLKIMASAPPDHRRLELREEEEGREEGMRTRDETVILRAASVLLCSVGLLAAWMPTAAALWLSMPTSATKCVSEEIHAGVVAMADYAVINDDDPRNAPTISVKVPEKLMTLMHNCGFCSKSAHR